MTDEQKYALVNSGILNTIMCAYARLTAKQLVKEGVLTKEQGDFVANTYHDLLAGPMFAVPAEEVWEKL